MFFVVKMVIPIRYALVPVGGVTATLGTGGGLFFLVLVCITFNVSRTVFLCAKFVSKVSEGLSRTTVVSKYGG